MTLRDAILHSKETGCEFWRASEPREVFKASLDGRGETCAEFRWHVAGDWYSKAFAAADILAADWVCSDGWTPECKLRAALEKIRDGGWVEDGGTEGEWRGWQSAYDAVWDIANKALEA